VSCDQPHPLRPDIWCDKDSPCYGYHANAPHGLVWPGAPLPERPPERARTRKGQLAEKVARITDPARNGL
jgi:hypothetical protein